MEGVDEASSILISSWEVPFFLIIDNCIYQTAGYHTEDLAPCLATNQPSIYTCPVHSRTLLSILTYAGSHAV